jgi:hypothetical protein
MIFNGKGAFIAGEKSAYHPNVDRIPFPQGIMSLLEQAKSNSNSIQFIPIQIQMQFNKIQPKYIRIPLISGALPETSRISKHFSWM